MQKVIDGGLVNYEVVGRGKKNLLILHGWKGQVGDWMEVARRLGERYKVYLLDLPGFGASMRPKEDWGIYEYFEFTRKFLQELNIKKWIVLGHSFGGRIAILLAARTNLVEKLILADAAGMELKSVLSRLIRLISPILRWLPQNFKNKFGSRDYREAGEMRRTFVKIVNQPLRKELIKITVPTLIVWGEKDKELSLTEAKLLHQDIKGSTLRIVWGAGHWPQREKLDDFMRILGEERI